MRQFLVFLFLSIFSFFFLTKYSKEDFVTEVSKKKHNKDKNFCKNLKTQNINFKDFISEIFDANKPKIDVYQNLDKINCYIEYLKKTKGYMETLALLEKLLNLTDDDNKDFIIKKVQEVLDSKNIEELYTAISLFYNKYDAYPRDLNQLVELGFLDSLPVEPYGSQYYIDPFGQVKRTRK